MQNCAALSTTLETFCDKTCLCVLSLLSIRYPTPARRDGALLFPPVMYHVSRSTLPSRSIRVAADGKCSVLASGRAAPPGVRAPRLPHPVPYRDTVVFSRPRRRKYCCGGRCVAYASVNNRFQVFWVDAQKVDCGVAR